MAESTGIHKINSLRRQWIGYRVLNTLLLALAIALLLGSLCHYLFDTTLWRIAIWFVVIITIFAIRKPWELSTETVSSFLNSTYPELEESAELPLKSGAELTLLQRLQLHKVEQALTDVPASPKQFVQPLGRTVLLLIAALAVNIVFAKLPKHSVGSFLTPITNDNK